MSFKHVSRVAENYAFSLIFSPFSNTKSNLIYSCEALVYGYYDNGAFIESGELTRPLEIQVLTQNVFYELELRVDASNGDVSVSLAGFDLGRFDYHHPAVGSGGYATLNGYGAKCDAQFQKYVLA